MDYIEAFRNLKTNNKYSRKSPHKAVLLLSIIDMYESCTISDNVIKYDDTLKSTFLNVWNKVLPDEATFLPEAYLPFWYMQSEGFWHIIPQRGKDDILKLMRDAHVKPSESKLYDCVNYAELDEDLYFLMTLQSGRSSLKRALLETYTTLSSRTIDRLSVSEDCFVDNSAIALDEYEKMLNASSNESTLPMNIIDNDIIQRFYALNEDIQYVLNIEYYKFLKEHVNEREMFKDICSSVYELYDKITRVPISFGEISPSIAFTYENFLADLKISLMGEDDSMDLIDSINIAIDRLSHPAVAEDITSSYKNYEEPSNADSFVVEKISCKDEALPSIDNQPLDRKGKAWTKEEEAELKGYYTSGLGYATIASLMGRTDLSIKSRLGLLGLIDYTYEPEEKKDRVICTIPIREGEYHIDNYVTGFAIIDSNGHVDFSDTGQAKELNGTIYRFNYKAKCLTVKAVKFDGASWIKGSKVIVALKKSDLYKKLNSDSNIEGFEDIVETESFQLNKIKYCGTWYYFNGTSISQNDITEGTNGVRNIDGLDDSDDTFNYVPKGKLKNIDENAVCSYDYLWVMAITDFMGEKTNALKLTFDELACMMIANAWNILHKHPELKEKEETLVKCIEYLIGESVNNMGEQLDWDSSKDIVYESIKDYPIGGVFEDAIESLLEKSPYNVLRLWLTFKDSASFISDSLQFSNSCLYAIHLRKFDSYIDVNPSWKRVLYHDNINLMRYFRIHYTEYLTKKSADFEEQT